VERGAREPEESRLVNPGTTSVRPALQGGSAATGRGRAVRCRAGYRRAQVRSASGGVLWRCRFKPTFGPDPYVPPMRRRLAHLGPSPAPFRCLETRAAARASSRDDPDSVVSYPRRHTTRRLCGSRGSSFGYLGEVCRVTIRRCRYTPIWAIGSSASTCRFGPVFGPGRHHRRGGGGFRALRKTTSCATPAGCHRPVRTTVHRGALAPGRGGPVGSPHDTSCFDGSLRPLAMTTAPVEAFEAGASRRAGRRPEQAALLEWRPAVYPFILTGKPRCLDPAALRRTTSR